MNMVKVEQKWSNLRRKLNQKQKEKLDIIKNKLELREMMVLRQGDNRGLEFKRNMSN